MFSGFMSLWIILFSCRYWIPEPGFGRERQHVLAVLHLERIALLKKRRKNTYAVKQHKDFGLLQTTAVLWFVQKLKQAEKL